MPSESALAKLRDGRIFVVEYKGELLGGDGVDETNEKCAIGEKWQRASGSEQLFAVIEIELGGRDMRGQLLAAKVLSS